MKTHVFALIARLATIVGLLATAQPAHAAKGGGGDPGGGSGCMAEIYVAASLVDLYLYKHKDLGVNSLEFQQALDPLAIKFVPPTQPLKYEGNDVDAYFDGNKIEVRCDRFLGLDADARAHVIAHELFRKLGREGDAYEITHKIPQIAGLTDTCGESREVLASLTGSYIEGFITCRDLQAQHRTRAPEYQTMLISQKLAQRTYAKTRALCNSVCTGDDVDFCNAMPALGEPCPPVADK